MTKTTRTAEIRNTHTPVAKAKPRKGDVVLKLFTGMVVGVYRNTDDAPFTVNRTATTIQVVQKNGILRTFDAKTGNEINPSNPRYPHKIEVA